MPASTIDPHAIAGMVARLDSSDYDRWAAQIRRTGGCRQPINMRGTVLHVDPATGRRLHTYTTHNEPGGVLRLPCKTRRATRCPACAKTYRGDTYQLIRAGLIGGKGVPASVSDHPCLFVTLTAPSFGQVHTRRENNGKVLPCHPRRDATPCPHGRMISCTARHRATDEVLGEPLCPDCYDYTGSVLFNAVAPLLWVRFADALRRRLATAGGLSLRELRGHLVLSFAKVAEYQRRGVVHLHAVIRLDGPDGPTSPPPAWATTDVLTAAVQGATPAVSARISTTSDEPVRVLRWGRQLDIRPITSGGDLTEQAVAAYVAKYATKAAECVGTLDRRIYSLEDLSTLGLRDHPRRLIAECFRLGALSHLAEHRLDHWAHMLGYRGHFSTRSRRYSLTIGDLRSLRAHHARQEEISTGRLPILAEDKPVIIARWTYAGRGLAADEQLLAAALTSPASGGGSAGAR
ncbi:replication initiator [Sphaerisporangium rhizosphaerae]|uniref:Replication initiator n=1 Tax=Sphaerisporangium rhizosphaerae TaxID=2269375 RepID=A0ABW2P520_9ACTN